MQKHNYTLTVIIPTYNRCQILEKCLNALNRQQKIDNYSLEIIVADDGSTDFTEEISRKFTTKNHWPLKYLNQSNQGANAARNAAIHAAEGQLLLFINDDTIATSLMIYHHIKNHEVYPEQNIGVLGRITISKDVPYTPIVKLHLDASFDKLTGKEWLDWTAFFTCNVSVKTDFLLQYGVFEETLRYHEDVELSERLSEYDFKLKYVPEALGFHDHYIHAADFLSVAERDGKALALWYKKSPQLGEKLTIFGFYPLNILNTNLRYRVGDFVFNKLTSPFFLLLAQFSRNKYENLSLAIYRKLYQSRKRKAIRNELLN